MSANGHAYFVSQCPLPCSWSSAPLGSADAAHEALRGHIASHTHGDLVGFVAAHVDAAHRYEKVTTP
jgi:hypothetical protein